MRTLTYIVTLTLGDEGRLEPELVLTRLHSAIATAIDEEHGDLTFYDGHATVYQAEVAAVDVVSRTVEPR